MLTSVFVHLKLQELFRHLDEDLGVISLNELAGSLDISRETLIPHLHTLEGLSLVHVRAGVPDVVHLTMLGRKQI